MMHDVSAKLFTPFRFREKFELDILSHRISINAGHGPSLLDFSTASLYPFFPLHASQETQV
jgi:hypothetical protein